MEIITKLGIDLKLIIGQVVNFLILFFVLRKLVYKPVLNLLEKRKNMIEKSVEDAKKIEERLVEMEVEKEEVLADASLKAMAVIEKAKQEAEEERQKALANAKKEISGLAERYRAQLKAEKDQISSELKAEMASLIITSCEKVIRKEFGKEDQNRLEKAIKNEISSVKLE